MCSPQARFFWPIATLSIAVLALFAAVAGAQVEVDVEVTGDAVPGGTVTATATVDIMDGSTLQSYSWAYEDGVAPAMLAGADTNAVTVTLGPLADYKEHLFEILVEPPVEADDLPPNVPLPEGEFPAGLQDRWQVVGLNPFSIEEAALVELELDVTTTSGTYTFDVEIHTTLPWKPTAGIRNVPIGIPVLLQGKEQMAYDWALDPPGGSGAALMDATTRNPEFVPDVTGLYTVTVTEDEGEAVVTLAIYAGTWRGVIVGEDADGRPVADAACTGCHSGFAPDLFTPWKDTGHAEAFTDNFNASSHFGERCFGCHTVGYDPDVDNGGMDDAADYQAFLDSGLLGNPDDDNWTNMLAQFAATAQLANIQCENCHGPQNGGAHGPSGPVGEPRASLSSDVCATCHGEPLRHGRFQQWQLSAHANYELAIDEGESGNCARCHTGNGFLEWLPILMDDDPGTDPTASIDVTWTVDETHPQTCQTCHDPHMAGTTSGNNTDARVRISDDTPPLIAGFTANDVGKGAICMTCHNSRRGARNDAVYPMLAGTSETVRAPHGSAQADMLMGQNAYFVEVGNRGSHSRLENVEDTCVTCHMVATPPPDILSYNQNGANHTFYASPDICSDCHAFPDASVIQGPVMAELMVLEGMLEDAILEELSDQIDDGNAIDLNGDALITDAADFAEIQIAESRGRQAITVTLADTTVVGPTRLNDVNVVPAVGDPMPFYNVANPNLLKAGWNYWLVYNDGSYGVHNPTFAGNVLEAAMEGLQTEAPACVDSDTTICLRDGRFKVEISWMAPGNPLGPAFVSNLRTSDSGIFYFVSPSNLEFLIKVLNGCSITDHYWVFFAATTDVGFTVTVTDTVEEVTKVYTNPLGNPADAVTDTQAFATCP